MKARDVMTSPAITVPPDMPVSEIARLLIERAISAVPVIGANGELVGIVSEGDLLRRVEADTDRHRPQWLELLLDSNVAAADFARSHGAFARDVMTANVVTAKPDTELAEIASLLERRRIKRVPVMEQGKVVGIVSRANLLHALVAVRRAGTDTVDTDADIRTELRARLGRNSGVDLDRVNIVVSDGIVHLWGTVKSENQRRALHAAASGMSGVRSVEDHLHHDWFGGSTGY